MTDLSKVISREKFKKFLEFLKQIPWTVGNRAFLFFAIMIFFAIAAGAAFSLKYVILSQRQISDSPEPPIFERQLLQSILETWQVRQEKLDKIDDKAYPNPFLPKSE
ncbi:MAG: hypothetical protein Q8N16_04035 [bacterium]|nr:hypothetical protein [bacterium]